MTDVVAFNPFEPGFLDDPYDQYRALRTHEPVHLSPIGPWMLFRYADVHRLLRDPSLSVDDHNAPPTLRDQAFAELAGDRRERGSLSMLNVDPPDHTRLRRLVQKAFTPRMIEGLRPRVQQLVDEALDAAAERGSMDVIADLAFPLPFTVISDMLGMPEGPRSELRAWSHTLAGTLDPVVDEAQMLAAIDASDHMTAYMSEVIAWKRKEPGDDLLSGLLAAEDGGDVLSQEELLDQLTLLYIAGHETTVNLIGNGTAALLAHPDQLERLRADPGLDGSAVEELLRFDSPVQFSRRVTVAPLEVDGHTIDAGSFALVCLGSANRDEARWGETADGLDLGRAGANQHVSFGGGAHHCLGAALARLEGSVAIGSLVRRFSSLALDGEPVGNARVVLRGLDALPVAVA